ncbi:hypothetical protein [Planctomicrobium sp. SH527]|uniref:hypothetical protein n=1 Tax=Planctomicrobium sp. SH527 TaxID=3448123 RepID=UPI003F5C73D1
MALAHLKLGLIGTEIDGATHEAIQRQPRLRIVELFDPCLNSAQAAAPQFEAIYSPSLDGLLRRTDAVIVSDVKWMGPEPIIRAAGLQRPALILSSVFGLYSISDLMRLQHFSELTSTLLMPELSCRWARATLRLRELTATRLQSIESMEIICSVAPDSHDELMVFDWCVNVVQSECLKVRSNPTGHEVTLGFRRTQRNGEPVTVHLKFEPASEACPVQMRFPIVKGTVNCRGGQLQIHGEQDVAWSLAGEAEKVESLQSDRTAIDVMYDLFGRRIVGGLVPVPDVRDLIKANTIRAARILSQSDSTEIPL